MSIAMVVLILLARPQAAPAPTAPPKSGPAGAAAQAQDPKQAKEPVYDEKADARAQIAAAAARAKRENRRVLVQWGANWCGWCKRLHAFCAEEPDVARKILYEYDVVNVDVGRFDKNVDLAQQYEAQIKAIPYLTILDGDGKLVANEETDPLETSIDGKPGYDSKRVVALLTKHQAPAANADELLKAALAGAQKGSKRLFVHFGAPW